MSTHIYDAVRIPKSSILEYTVIARKYAKDAIEAIIDEAKKLTAMIDASCAIEIRDPDRHPWRTISEEAYNVISWYWSILDNCAVTKLREEEKKLLMDYMASAGITDPEALYKFLKACSFSMAGQYEFQFYEIPEAPFTVMRWRNLPSSVQEAIYDTYPDFCFQDQSEAPCLKSQNKEFGAYVESRLDMIDELAPEMRRRIMQLVADGYYQERERLWDKLTAEEFTISTSALRYPFLTTQEKIKYTRAILLRKYKEEEKK